MKYGYFDDSAKEYVITTPATPLPWINYLGNNGFFSLISNTCGGYSFFKDAKLRRITRFRYNNVPSDFGGRYYYIKDGNTVWNPGFMPAKTPLDHYECRHGLGYSRFISAKNGVSVDLTCFVPLGEALEVHKLTVTNETAVEKHVSITSAIEWCLWNAVDDATNFQRNYNIGEVEMENGIVYHKSEYRERRNHYAFFGPNCPVDGFDTDLSAFLGQLRSWENPETVEFGISRNSIASGWAPMASQRIDLTLGAGESRTILFRLGYVENKEDEKFSAPNVINKKRAYSLMDRFSATEQADEALRSLRDYWEGLLSRFTISSGDGRLDRMVNVWNQYQCMVTFNMSRSASYFESGTGRGMGFRDSCQDLLGFVHLVPERARERILDIAAIQFPNGSTYHQYQPLTKRGNADIGTGFNDDPLWLIACVIAYLKETGDFTILDEPVPFDNCSDSEVPLMEHLRRSIRYTMENKGAHGLPLIGRADWNDCLNLNCFSEEPGESFQTCSNYDSKTAESVFIAAMFVLYGREYAALCEKRGDVDESKLVSQEVNAMERAVLEHGWDGEWFLRAYDAYGEKIGSRENLEGQIFIEPQGFCAMAGIGGEPLARQALNAVSQRLVGQYGVELLHPCYTKYYKELGEISSYPPGYKENGSIFCHNNPWIVLAYTVLGDAAHAFDVYRRTCPAYIEDASDIHRTEPYVYSQTIAGRDAQNSGEAKNSWLTGSAAWSFVAVSQGILGIIPEYDGIRLSPCLPDEIDGYHVTRVFRGKRYEIDVRKNQNKTGLLVNGAPVAGTRIPLSVAEICRVELYV